MGLSVVVPTLNARDTLAGCLDALAEHAPDAEVLVVNGPSADGTTGMVRERDDVDVLVELADRDINAARNAGIDHADGDAVAFIDHRVVIGEHWCDAVENGLETADAVTGPTRPRIDATTGRAESRVIAGRTVTYLNAGNVALRAPVLDELDGFDEYLTVGGMRDLSHRLAGNDRSVRWDGGMRTRPAINSDGGEDGRDWGWKYRSLSYRLAKNYNLRPTVVRRLLSHSSGDAYKGMKQVARGGLPPSHWFANGRAVLRGLVGGSVSGVRARRHDRTPRRNPHGRSSRADRAVTVYDWR